MRFAAQKSLRFFVLGSGKSNTNVNYLLEESLGGICFCFEAMDFAEEMPKILFVFVHFCSKGTS